MGRMPTDAPTIDPGRGHGRRRAPDETALLSTPWVTIVWNDPVNLMSYVTYVFQTYFGYAKAKAEKLMLEVHQEGKSVVSQRHARGDGARRPGHARVRPVGDPGQDRRLIDTSVPDRVSGR